ncbi:MAG TPA: hypothetical protein VIO61_16140 [Anaerolineaceae bacterium]
MNKIHPTGLGEPQPVGKSTLFQPADEKQESQKGRDQNLAFDPRNADANRVRTTLELTSQAFTVIQQLQYTHRLQTGKVFPLWKLVSQVIESYGKAIASPPTLHPEPALHEPDGKREV